MIIILNTTVFLVTMLRVVLPVPILPQSSKLPYSLAQHLHGHRTPRALPPHDSWSVDGLNDDPQGDGSAAEERVEREEGETEERHDY